MMAGTAHVQKAPARRTPRRPVANSKRTLLVTNTDGSQFTIEVDASWKITFSAFNPGSKYGGDGTATLRIYEAENKQRAVFRNVQSFHDLALNVQRFAIDEYTEREVINDGDGTTVRQVHSTAKVPVPAAAR